VAVALKRLNDDLSSEHLAQVAFKKSLPPFNPKEKGAKVSLIISNHIV